MKHTLKVVFVLMFHVNGWSVEGAAEPARKPNIVVILADDLGYADLGCHGGKDIPTPHIDSLAHTGIRCTSGYVSHPFCSPTRAGLLTGRYQQRFGHENNPVYAPDDPKIGLPIDQLTLANVLQSAGYVTGAIGKWHLGAAPAFHPNNRGFAEYFGLIGGGHDYFKSDLKSRTEYLLPLFRNQESLELQGYLTDLLSQEAAAFVERNKSKPFFLYLAYNAPHTPLQAPPKYLDRFKSIQDEKRRSYAAMVSAMDDGVGLLLSKLKELNLENDTLAIFLNDNGGPSRYNSSRNHPLKGDKGDVYEGGIRVPFLVRWPGRLPQGKTYDDPVISLDILPTAAAAAGCDLAKLPKIDGVNFLPHLLGEAKTPPHETLYWRTYGGKDLALRQGRYKLLRNRKGRELYANSPLELYDLAADIGETKNLAAEQADRVAKMMKDYQAWNAELTEPLWPHPQPKKK